MCFGGPGGEGQTCTIPWCSTAVLSSIQLLCSAPSTFCRYTEAQKPRVIVSLAAVGLFMAVGWPLIVYYTGWWGLVKYWLMPWLGYHFWMSEYERGHGGMKSDAHCPPSAQRLLNMWPALIISAASPVLFLPRAVAGTFTVVHHTAPHIPFKPAGEWNAAKAQLSGTVHCDYPRVSVPPCCAMPLYGDAGCLTLF